MTYQLRPYTVGQSIGKALSIYLDHIFLFLFIGLAFSAISSGSLYWVTRMVQSQAEQTSIVFLAILVAFPLNFLVNALISSILARVIAVRFLGSGSLRDEVIVTLRALPKAIVATLLTLFATFGGFILLVVPGIIVSLGLIFVELAVVVEGCGPIAALKRSWNLTKGLKGNVFGFTVLLSIISSAVVYPIQYLAGPALRLIGLGAIDAWAPMLGQTVANAFLLPFSAAAHVVFYIGMRVSKESLDVESLAKDFGSAPAPAEAFPSFSG